MDLLEIHQDWYLTGQGWKINGIMVGHGCLAAMEHKAGIEQVSGHGFGSGY